MGLQGYDFEVVHAKGISNPSDFLSRHTNRRANVQKVIYAEECINFLISHVVLKTITVTLIQKETPDDVMLRLLTDMIHKDKCEEADDGRLAQFRKIKEELTVNAEATLFFITVTS